MKRSIWLAVSKTLLVAISLATFPSCGHGGSTRSYIDGPVGVPLVAPRQGRAGTARTIPLAGAPKQLESYPAPIGADSARFATLRGELGRLLSAKGVNNLVSGPPTDTPNRVTDLTVANEGGGIYHFTFSYRNVGDYDQNGEVGISDLGPLANEYGAKSADTNYSVYVDGDQNNEIGISDLGPLANHYSSLVDGYLIQGSSTQAGPFVELARVNLSQFQRDPKNWAKFDGSLSIASSAYTYFEVKPTAGSVSGIPSDPVLSFPVPSPGQAWMTGQWWGYYEFLVDDYSFVVTLFDPRFTSWTDSSHFIIRYDVKMEYYDYHPPQKPNMTEDPVLKDHYPVFGTGDYQKNGGGETFDMNLAVGNSTYLVFMNYVFDSSSTPKHVIMFIDEFLPDSTLKVGISLIQNDPNIF